MAKNLDSTIPLDRLDAYKKLIASNPKIELKGANVPYIVKKDFVLVPDTLLKNFKEFKPYFDISFNYVASLKAK